MGRGFIGANLWVMGVWWEGGYEQMWGVGFRAKGKGSPLTEFYMDSVIFITGLQPYIWSL